MIPLRHHPFLEERNPGCRRAKHRDRLLEIEGFQTHHSIVTVIIDRCEPRRHRSSHEKRHSNLAWRMAFHKLFQDPWRQLERVLPGRQVFGIGNANPYRMTQKC